LANTVSALQREVLEREEAEASNLRLAAQLAHADRVESMGHLAVSLAHELYQPLGAIANYAEASDVVASRSADAAAAKTLHEYLTQVKSASLRAGDIVRRIRNFVRPGLGQVEEVELNDLAEEVVELCRPEAEHAGVALAVERSGQPLTAAVDPIQIQQVLVNLIQNGLHALGDGPRDERRLTVRLTATSESAQVDVTDTGPGLTPADAERLFEPFHTSREDGLGMGLPICRSIVEHHHGTIWARSAPGGGAQFSFILPRTSTHDGQPRQHTDRVCR
jgi:two-component system sensor kinase FixL